MQATNSWTHIVITRGLLLFSLYFSSVGLIFYQQWFLKEYRYPLFITAFNQFIKFLFAALYRTVYECYTGESRVRLCWSDMFKSMAVLGLFGGLHVALSNCSLEVNTVSVFTVSKSSSIIFILIFAAMLGLEKITWKLIIIVLMISCGLALFTYKSAQLVISGFIVALAAALMSSFRWTFAQYIFQKSKLGIDNPIDMMYYVDLWVFIIIMPIAVVLEGEDLIEQMEDTAAGVTLFVLSMASAALTFVMEVTKYLVLHLTSSLTVSVVLILKEIATLVLAHFCLRDEMSTINFLGLVLSLGGVIAHAVFKYRKAKKRYYEEIESGNNKPSSSESKPIGKNKTYVTVCQP